MKRLSSLLLVIVMTSMLFLTSCSGVESDGLFIYKLNEETNSYEISIIQYPIMWAEMIPVMYNGNDVTKIADGGFAGYKQLQSVSIPGTIKEIGTYAFGSCINLNDVSFEEGLEIIDDYAFANCSSLQVVCLPSSITELGICSFGGCTSLQAIFYMGTRDEWNALAKENGWYEGSDALYECRVYFCEGYVEGKQDTIAMWNTYVIEKMFYTHAAIPLPSVTLDKSGNETFHDIPTPEKAE